MGPAQVRSRTSLTGDLPYSVNLRERQCFCLSVLIHRNGTSQDSAISLSMFEVIIVERGPTR
jgi:hypothetical protein